MLCKNQNTRHIAMRMIFAIIVVLFMGAALYAKETASQGDYVYRQTFEDNNFTQLSIEAKADVFISQSDTASVEIFTKETDRMDYTKVVYKKGKLSIKANEPSSTVYFMMWKWETGGKSFDTNMQVYIKAPNIEEIKFDSGGSLTFETDFELKSLELQTGYNSKATFQNIKSKKVKITTSSYAETQYAGIVAESLEISIGYNGKAIFGDISTQDAKITTASYADVQFSNVVTNRGEINIGYNGKATFGGISSQDTKIVTASYAVIRFSDVVAEEKLGVNLGYEGKATMGDLTSKDVKITLANYADIQFSGKLAVDSFDFKR